MFGGHFYHASIRRFVSAFGSLFNDIKVVRSNGSSLRVPLAYGPKEKFLSRIEEQIDLESPKVAIKLPRMSFEITNIVYDTQSKLNRNNRILIGEKVYYTYAPYNISLSLSVMTKSQDDALQVIEQIIPYFQPDYNITIKESVSDALKTDIPITLSGIDMSEDYEGDFMSRRAIVYTLSFDAKVRFYGPERKTGVIKRVIVNTYDTDYRERGGYGYEQYSSRVDPIGAQSDQSYEIVKEIEYLGDPAYADITLKPAEFGGNSVEFILLEKLTGVNSGARAVVEVYESGSRNISATMIGDVDFLPGEVIIAEESGAERVVDTAYRLRGY